MSCTIPVDRSMSVLLRSSTTQVSQSSVGMKPHRKISCACQYCWCPGQLLTPVADSEDLSLSNDATSFTFNRRQPGLSVQALCAVRDRVRMSRLSVAAGRRCLLRVSSRLSILHTRPRASRVHRRRRHGTRPPRPFFASAPSLIIRRTVYSESAKIT